MGILTLQSCFFLIEKEELSLANVHALLNKHSGLLGLSGYAGDMRDLLEEAEQGDRRCTEAVDVFCYRAKKYIGSYMAALNGSDALIFTGGIGENSAIIRQKIIENLTFLGLEIDTEKNEQVDGFSAIHSEDSKVEIYVIPTNEELVIAIDAAKIAIAAQQTPWA